MSPGVSQVRFTGGAQGIIAIMRAPAWTGFVSCTGNSIMATRFQARRAHAAAGFTLIEIMVVVVILGILAALIAPNVISRIDEAQVAKVKNDVRQLESALKLFRMDRFRYPTGEEGLEALTTAPTEAGVPWPPGGYLDRAPKDPWGRPYRYETPGKRSGGEYDIYSLGRDGQEGGEGVDADIGNWDNPK
jgi:general secretion pathway protein G